MHTARTSARRECLLRVNNQIINETGARSGRMIYANALVLFSHARSSRRRRLAAMHNSCPVARACQIMANVVALRFGGMACARRWRWSTAPEPRRYCACAISESPPHPPAVCRRKCVCVACQSALRRQRARAPFVCFDYAVQM